MDQTSKEKHIRSLEGSPDSGRFFRYIAEFLGFCDDDAEAVRETRFIVEKHLPRMIGDFYTQLLRYPPTRKFFLKKDGTIDQDYLRLRMHHQNNFWRRVASGVYDDEFASFVDYVGKAHTSRGADSRIYIPARYVIGMVGFVQNAISKALHEELKDVDPDLEGRAIVAWNQLSMVLLEMLSRSYGTERQEETYETLAPVQEDAVLQLALETYESGLGMARSIEYQDVVVGRVDEIPEGERKVVQVDELSIGVFHHEGNWYALRNSCLHRGGPVCTGPLENEILTCPWHGYTYELKTGTLTLDRTAALESYPIEIRDGEIHLRIKRLKRDIVEIDLDGEAGDAVMETSEIKEPETTISAPLAPNEFRTADVAPGKIALVEVDGEPAALAPNEFKTADITPGKIALVEVDGEPVAVYNLAGTFYATHNECTHVGGPLNEGELEGDQVICPWHGSCFDVTDGHVTCGPADEPLRAYPVVIEGEIGRVG